MTPGQRIPGALARIASDIEKILEHRGATKVAVILIGRGELLRIRPSPSAFDYALITTAPISPTWRQYAREGQSPIEPDLDCIRAPSASNPSPATSSWRATFSATIPIVSPPLSSISRFAELPTCACALSPR